MHLYRTAVLTILAAIGAPLQAAEVPAQRIDGNAPRYDRGAQQLFREGWVYLELKITSEGIVEGVTVNTSYPKGMFDDEAVAAAKTWKFTPKLVDGVPVADPAYRSAIRFSVQGARSVTPDHIDEFRRALSAIRNQDLGESEKRLKRLRELYAAEKFNLTEAARYYQFEGIAANQRQDFQAALDWIEKALRLAEFLDNKQVVDNLHLQTIVAYVGAKQFDNAVDYFDSWNWKARSTPDEKIAAVIGEYRSAGFGKGHFFEIASYDEAVKEAKKQTFRGGKVPPSEKK